MDMEPETTVPLFICKECRFQISNFGLMRLHMIHMHGASTTWPEKPPLGLSDAEADELYRFTYDAYVDPNRWPALRKLLVRIDEHLGRDRLPKASSQ
jgi:hypothetical protein